MCLHSVRVEYRAARVRVLVQGGVNEPDLVVVQVEMNMQKPFSGAFISPDLKLADVFNWSRLCLGLCGRIQIIMPCQRPEEVRYMALKIYVDTFKVRPFITGNEE